MVPQQRETRLQRFLNLVVLGKARAQQGDHAVTRPDLVVSERAAGCFQTPLATAPPQRLDGAVVSRICVCHLTFYLQMADWLHTLAGCLARLALEIAPT